MVAFLQVEWEMEPGRAWSPEGPAVKRLRREPLKLCSR